MEKEQSGILREQLTIENVSRTILRERRSIHRRSFSIQEYGGRFPIVRQPSKIARSRLIIASSRFIFAFSRLPDSVAASFASDSMSFLERDPSTRNDEDIIMPTTNKSIHRATISLDVPAKIADVILYANNIVQMMTNNPAFPTPTPTIAVLNAAVSDLHAAETAALSRAKGSATVRNDKRTTLVSLLQQLRGYVQSVADATPETGAAIIESAGLTVRKIPTRGKQAFVARQGALSGSAIVTAVSAGPRSSYEWQYSTAPHCEFQRENGLHFARERFGAIARATPSHPAVTPTRVPGAAAGTAARCSR